MNHPDFPLKSLAVAALALAVSVGTHAEPSVMLGVSHNFGGATGVTFKVLSTNRQDRAAAAVGVSYFPGQGPKTWGFDTSLGYTFRHGAVTLGYDWLNEQVQMSLGAANTEKKPVVVPPAPAPEPAPAPVAEAKKPAKKTVKKPKPAPAPAPAPAPEPAPAPAPVPEPAPAPAPAPEPAPAPAPAPEPPPVVDNCLKVFRGPMATVPDPCAPRG